MVACQRGLTSTGCQINSQLNPVTEGDLIAIRPRIVEPIVILINLFMGHLNKSVIL